MRDSGFKVIDGLRARSLDVYLTHVRTTTSAAYAKRSLEVRVLCMTGGRAYKWRPRGVVRGRDTRMRALGSHSPNAVRKPNINTVVTSVTLFICVERKGAHC